MTRKSVCHDGIGRDCRADQCRIDVDGFSLNGTNVPPPGLNSSFGLYVEGTLALHAKTFAGQYGFLISPDSPYTMMDAFFFNTATSRVQLPPDGQGVVYVLVNDGFGTLDLTVPEPATLGLLGTGLIGLLALRRRSASHDCELSVVTSGRGRSQLRSPPIQGRKYMQTEQLPILAFAAMVVVLVLGLASMYQ